MLQGGHDQLSQSDGPIKIFPVARHLGLAAVSARRPRSLVLEDTEEVI